MNNNSNKFMFFSKICTVFILSTLLTSPAKSEDFFTWMWRLTKNASEKVWNATKVSSSFNQKMEFEPLNPIEEIPEELLPNYEEKDNQLNPKDFISSLRKMIHTVINDLPKAGSKSFNEQLEQCNNCFARIIDVIELFKVKVELQSSEQKQIKLWEKIEETLNLYRTHLALCENEQEICNTYDEVMSSFFTIKNDIVPTGEDNARQ